MKAIGLLLLAVFAALLIDNKTSQTTQEITQPTWSVTDSKAYARDLLLEWKDKQWVCLSKLWGKESNWNPNAFNTTLVMGKNAGGIPQLLGLDPDTPAPRQIERGLDYIYYRYTTPCNAWAHFKKKGWH